MKKKRMLAWLLALVFALTAPLPGIANKALAESNPTPPSPPNLTEVIPETDNPNHLIMWCDGWGPEGWGYMWRLSSNPDMLSSLWDDFTDEYANSVGFTEELFDLIDGMMVYLAARYFHGSSSDIVSEWSNIYSVEINDNGEIINVEPYEDPQSQCPNSPSGLHEWNWVEEDSTDYDCTKPYNVRQVCKHCGTKGASKTNPANYLNHDWSDEFVVVFEPTTDMPGKGYYSCKHLGCTVRKIEEIPKLGSTGHICDMQPYTIRAATCTENGLQCKRCTICHTELPGSRKEIIAPGHILKRETTRRANCQQTGIEVETCERPGCTYKETINTGFGPHAWTYSENPDDKLDDCAKSGKVRMICDLCGLKSELIDHVAMPNHYWDLSNFITTKEPSCTEKGQGYYPCQRCNSGQLPEEIPMLEHRYEPKTTKQPSCTEAGEKAEVCVREGCGHIKEGSTEPIDALEHKYEVKYDPAPTCTEAGEKTEVCVREGCGHIKEGSRQTVDPTGHDLERKVKIPAKCLEYGKSIMACKNCPYEDPTTEQDIDPPGHSWEERITQEPTCTEKGWTRKYCTVCEALGDYGLVDALGHDIVDDGDKDPTCTEWGWIRGHCSRCDYTQQLDLEPHGHDWEDVKTIREPTCKDEGVKLVRCRICNEEKEEAIPTNDVHDLVEEVSVEPTCTEWGKYRVYCKRCGFETVKGDKPPKGHTEVPVQDELFNCMDGGWVGVTKCSVCGETVNVGTYHAATGRHSWGPEEIIEAPACNKLGKAQSFCTVCGEERIRELPPEDHTWDLVVLYPASCLATGREQWQCLVCGRTGRTETIPTNEDHKWVTRQGREPTCSLAGYTESISCEICGKIQKQQELIPTIPHKEVIVHSMRPTTTLEGRTEGIRCGVCGTWIVECRTLPKLAPERTETEVSEQPAGWAQGSTESASFKSEADISEFSHVAINGEMVDESNYELREGSTIVIFKPEFLETLPMGEYKVEIVSIGSTAVGMLEVMTQEALDAKVEAIAAAEAKQESSGYQLWLALIILSAIVLIFLARKKIMKKQED